MKKISCEEAVDLIIEDYDADYVPIDQKRINDLFYDQDNVTDSNLATRLSEAIDKVSENIVNAPKNLKKGLQYIKGNNIDYTDSGISEQDRVAMAIEKMAGLDVLGEAVSLCKSDLGMRILSFLYKELRGKAIRDYREMVEKALFPSD